MNETLKLTIINLQYVYLYNLLIAYNYGMLKHAWILKILP